MSEAKNKIITKFVDLAEAFIRENKESIFHDGYVIHRLSHTRAQSPTFSALLMRCIIAYHGIDKMEDLKPGNDPITEFYIRLPAILGNGFSAYPSVRKDHPWAGSRYEWETTLMQRLTELGINYLELPLAIVWLQYELEQKIISETKDDGSLSPDMKVGTEVYNAINVELSKRFEKDYQDRLEELDREEAERATVEAAAPPAAQNTAEPKGVEHLLVDPNYEMVTTRSIMPKEETKDDGFDINALDALNIDDALERVDAKRSGGGEAIVVGEGDNDCGDACKI
ncbi:hypothetical protein SPLA10_PHROGS00103 [Salmonella phage SPLA10]|nr:hypothetical protein SPLA10_PHROGS00103 [Salmonella phage SPLA10]